MDLSLGQRLRDLPGPVLLTGHTGFKGTWMTFLLETLGISVIGYSLPPEKDSLFDRSKRTGSIPEAFADIRDYLQLENFIKLYKPSVIIHMAAQPLVLKSYSNPHETFEINVMGTANLCDIAFKYSFVESILIVTTDKVYKNNNLGTAFNENSPLEGKDPYSASKVGTEAVIKAWQQISKTSGGPIIVSGRAGNVVGGGDFADNRIIPDLIRGLVNQKSITIRNPHSIRPWLHVVDPLLGYISALEKLLNGIDFESLNFGPEGEKLTVGQLIEIAYPIFPELRGLVKISETTDYAKEATVLALDSNLSSRLLGWRPILDQTSSITLAFQWWQEYLKGSTSSQELCIRDIAKFLSKTNVKEIR